MSGTSVGSFERRGQRGIARGLFVGGLLALLVLAPAGVGAAVAWERPCCINQDDSEAFTQDCATLLGWLLAGDLPDEAVQGVWREALA